MDKKEINIAGMSLPSVIFFINEDYESSINVKKPDSTPQVEFIGKKNKIFKFLDTIPFIRGLSKLFWLFFCIIKKRLPIFILIFSIILYSKFGPQQVVTEVISKGWFWDNFLTLVFFGTVLGYLFLAFENHGAEHKVIGAFETNKDLTLKNIKKQPKENRRCGGVLAIWYLAFLLFYEYVLKLEPSIFISLLCISIAHEVFLLARRKDLIGKITYFPGWLVQKITTREPKEDLLLKARSALVLLLDKRGYDYIKEIKNE